MKTQNQKHDERFSKRAARWRAIFSQRISQWWDNVVEWADDNDFGELCANIFFVLLIAGGFFGFIYLGVHKSHKDKTTDSTADSVAVIEVPHCTKKSCRVDWDLDTITVLAPNEKGYKLHFKGKVPYYLTIENLDTIQ
jgi:hypothetical protein